MNLNDQLDEALRLEALATPGPWCFYRADAGPTVQQPRGWLALFKPGYSGLEWDEQNKNAKATVAARNILRPLGEAYKAAIAALEASHADRETMKQRLDGVYGALADAESVVVVTDDPGESVRAITAERDKLRAELEAARLELGERQPKPETESEP